MSVPTATQIPRYVDVLVVGGAAAGLATCCCLGRLNDRLGARMSSLADPSKKGRSRRDGPLTCLAVDPNMNAGDVWRQRYQHLHLHDIKAECALPFHPIPDSFPTFIPAPMFAGYLDEYRAQFKLPVLYGSKVTAIRQLTGTADRSVGGAPNASNVNAAARGRVASNVVTSQDVDTEESGDEQLGCHKKWAVTIEDQATKERRTVHSRHVVIANGIYNDPVVPEPFLSAMQRVDLAKSNSNDDAHSSLSLGSHGDDGSAMTVLEAELPFGPVLHSARFTTAVDHFGDATSAARPENKINEERGRDGEKNRQHHAQSCARKTVLVVGTGNTAVDMAMELHAAGHTPVVLARGTTSVVPQPFVAAVQSFMHEWMDVLASIPILPAVLVPVAAVVADCGLALWMRWRYRGALRNAWIPKNRHQQESIQSAQQGSIDSDDGGSGGKRFVDSSTLRDGIKLPSFGPLMTMLRTMAPPTYDKGFLDAVASGAVAVTSHEVSILFDEGVVLSNGDVLEVDGIVLATGFKVLSGHDGLLPADVVSALGTGTSAITSGGVSFVTGKTAVPALWFVYNRLQMINVMSRCVAAQIAVQELGLIRGVTSAAKTLVPAVVVRAVVVNAVAVLMLVMYVFLS